MLYNISRDKPPHQENGMARVSGEADVRRLLAGFCRVFGNTAGTGSFFYEIVAGPIR